MVDVLIESIKEEVHIRMFLADDILLLAESREAINATLEIWRITFVYIGVGQNTCIANFASRQLISDLAVKLGD